MFDLLSIAGVLCIILGLIHSVVGEALIFRTGEISSKKFRGIVWATWHMATLFAFALAGVLLFAPRDALYSSALAFTIMSVCIGLSSALVLFATKGRHPGWIVLAVIAGLIFFGARY